MKSTAKVPFKNKKTPYNLNEVDVNLLLKNPSSIRKIVKGNKEVPYHDDEEEEEDEDDKLDKHMKRYISEYFDNKYKKESDQRKKNKFDFKNLLPFKGLSEWEVDLHEKTKEHRKQKQEKSMKR